VLVDAAYPDAAVGLRNHKPAKPEEGTMPKDTTPAVEPETTTTDTTEERSAPGSTGSLNVEDRAASTREARLGLADEFRAREFPGEVATMPWSEFGDRAITWSPSVDLISKARADAGQLGYDQRWVWPTSARVAVDAGATSLDVFTQSARTLATAANVVRAIDAVTAKPETASTPTIVTTALKQVASIYTNVPNIQLEQPASTPSSSRT
jgi:hypothetical protein